MNRLWVRLMVAFVTIAIISIGTVGFLSARTTGQEFRQYVLHNNMVASKELIGQLISFYRANNGWEGAEALLSEGVQGGGMGMGMMGRARRGMDLSIADAGGQVVASTTQSLMGDRLSRTVLSQGIPLEVDGARVGTVLSLRTDDLLLDEKEELFLNQVRRSLIWAGLAATAMGLLLGLVLSRTITAPLRHLTEAAGAIAAGTLSQRVRIEGNDEFGELGKAFNAMAASLEESETLRRNMTADIAHELRTPLTIIQGNLQAILDGIYPLDQAQVAGLFDETKLLTRLVDDLRELALAEAGQLHYQMGSVQLDDIARRATASFSVEAESAGIRLEFTAPQLPPMVGDSDRLGQVLRILISNALLHTPTEGRITVAVDAPDTEHQRIMVSDTGAGIAEADLPRLFDRFYRGDRSRSRRSGGSGLGLTIARQLVHAHGGQIRVQSAPDRGTLFTIDLPVRQGDRT